MILFYHCALNWYINIVIPEYNFFAKCIIAFIYIQFQGCLSHLLQPLSKFRRTMPESSRNKETHNKINLRIISNTKQNFISIIRNKEKFTFLCRIVELSISK